MIRMLLALACLSYIPAFSETQSSHGALREPASGSKLAYREKLESAKKASSYLFGDGPKEEAPIYRRCTSCHENQDPHKVIHYNGSVGGKPLKEVKVTVDFETLDDNLRALFTGLETLVPFAGEGKRVKLGKIESYRLMTALHRAGIHFKTPAEKAAVEKVRAFLAEYTNLTDPVQSTYLKFNAPFPDIELRRRVSQVFGSKRQPPDSVRKAFTDLGEAVGVPAATMEEWIREAPRTRLTSDQER
jgi:hypothetical protein